MQRIRILAALGCSFGGLVFGYDLGAMAAAAQNLRTQFHLSPLHLGTTVSMSLWGTVCGALLAGRLADVTGRRALVSISSLVYGLAVLVLILAGEHWPTFLAARFFCGAAIGSITVICPLYMAEVSAREMRGQIVGLFQLQVGIGVVLAFGTGLLMSRFVAGPDYWRWCIGFGMLPAGILLSAIPAIPEEPRWLASRGRWSAAHSAAEKLNSRDDEWPDVVTGERSCIHPGRAGRLFQRMYRKPLLLATSIAVFNQLSGVNVLLLYLLDVLSSAGFSGTQEHRYAVYLSVLNLMTTLLGLAGIDRIGRKPLLVAGAAGMALCLVLLAVTIPLHVLPLLYLVVLVAYNAFFASSQGTVIWVYLSELFPFGVRGAGQGYGTSVHWIANAALTLMFPWIHRQSHAHVFYFFALMMVVQIAVIIVWYPETRGASLGIVATASEIQASS